jgi:hypothetical protein
MLSSLITKARIQRRAARLPGWWIINQQAIKLQNFRQSFTRRIRVEHPLWKACQDCLERELSEIQLSTWIRPLHAQEEAGALRLLAPNRFVLDWVRKHHLAQIQTVLKQLRPNQPLEVLLEIGSSPLTAAIENPPEALVEPTKLLLNLLSCSKAGF